VVTKAEVEMAYRLILGREPEDERVVAQHAVPSRTLDHLRQSFLGSEEFRIRLEAIRSDVGDFGCKALDWAPVDVEVDVSPAVLERMIERIEREFQHMGETEPHWSVISTEEFRAENIESNEEAFFHSGQGVVNDLRATASRCGVELPRRAGCFELGCGLGRSTMWLADEFAYVLAADVSAAHLELAKRAMLRFGKLNVELRHINTIRGLEELAPFDVFFSIIVFQHNPPPLIAYMLRTILAKLNPGGIGYFQVPTYIYGYKFDAENYLAIEQTPSVPEMHALPQPILLDIIREAGCRLLEIREDGAAGRMAISNRIFVQKG
jgi:SAM-dependent methyltransferase